MGDRVTCTSGWYTGPNHVCQYDGAFRRHLIGFRQLNLELNQVDSETGYSYTFTSKPDDLVAVGPSSTSGLVAHPIGTSLVPVPRQEDRD